jgi:hypothetical protein
MSSDPSTHSERAACNDSAVPSRAPLAGAVVARGARICFLAALFATVLIHFWQAGTPYVYKGGAISADAATVARSFAHYGVIGLHGVPVANNPPLDLRNDSYIHWPPLLPILLSVCFRVFGESEIVAHLFMLCVLLLNTLLVYKIANHLMGSRAAQLAGFFWLTLPVVVSRTQIVLQQSLAVVLILAAVFCWLKAAQTDRLDWKWTTLGVLAVFSGVFTSWETVLLVPGLWLAAATSRRRDFRLATLYTLAIGLSLAGLIALYAFAQPDLLTDTLQTMKFRMGLSADYSHRVIRNSGAISVSLPLAILFEFFNHVLMLGVLGCAALFWLLRGGIKRLPALPDDARIVLYGLASPWIIWYALMRQHGAAVDCEMIIAAPLTALALTALTARLRPPTRPWEWVFAALLLCVFVRPLVTSAFQGLERPPNGDRLLRAAEVLKKSTAENAVILWPTDSTVPLYYSHRHVVRMVSDAQIMGQALAELRLSFPQSPLYLAVPPELSGGFPGVLHNRIVNTSDVILVRL